MILEHTTRPAASWSDCYDFELSGSNDGVNWTSLLDYRVWQQGDNTVFIDSKGQAYKYFRWYMPRMGSGRGQFAGIAELTMYGYIR
jgi:hypothetical protein